MVASCNLFKTQVRQGTALPRHHHHKAQRFQFPLFILEFKSLHLLVQARFLTLFPKYSFPLYPTNHLTYRDYRPQSKSLCQLVLCQNALSSHVHLRTLTSHSQTEWLSPYSAVPQHLFVPLSEHSCIIFSYYPRRGLEQYLPAPRE